MENLILTEPAIFSLQVIRKWAKFIAVVMFIMIGIMVLAGIGMGFTMNRLNETSTPNPMPLPGIFFPVTYLLMALVYFFPVLYLYRFAQYLGNALNLGSSEELTSAFLFLRKHYNIAGILMIIFLGIMVLAIIVAVIVAIFGLAGMNRGGEFSMLL